MGRIVKISLSIIAAIILLLIIVAVALPFFINPNDFKPEIQNAVKENIGRDLQIDGDLELSVFPWIGISTGKLVLSNAKGFSEKPFAEIEKSNVKVKLIPLLSKKVEVSRVVLKGLDLYLAKNKQGKSNWDDLSKGKTESTTPENEDDQDTDENAMPLAALAVGGISIEQAHIIWDDQQTGNYTEVNDFNFNTGKLKFDEPISIDMSLSVVNKEPQLTETIKFSTELTVNEQLNIFSLNKTQLDSETISKLLPGDKLIANLLANIGINLPDQTLDIDALKLNSGNLTLSADIKGNNITNSPGFDGSININTPDLTQFMQSVGYPLPASTSGKTLKNFSVSSNVKSTANSANISNLKIKLDDLNLKGSATVDDFKNPVINSDINVATFNLADLLNKLAIPIPEIKDPTVLSQLAFSFVLKATSDSADIQNLIIKLDDLNLKGMAKVNNFNEPAIESEINIESFDAARMLNGLSISLPEMQDLTVLKKLALAFKLSATKDSADIQNIAIKLDDSNIKGSATIKNFAKPAIGFDITVDALDADRYLAAQEPEQTAQKAATPSAAAVAASNLFPVETLRGLNINGRLNVGQLKVNQLKMKGINFKLNAKNGEIKTEQSISQLYQGSYSGRSSINVKNKTPAVSLNEKLKGVQIEQLLTDMKVESRISGKVTANANIQGWGNSVPAIKSSLKGKADFNFKDSVVKGFNLQKIIDNSRTLIEGKPIKTDHKSDQTVFSVISGTAKINKGIINNNDLLAQSSKVRVKGNGTVNLTTEAIDYKVSTRVIKRSATETEAEKIRGIPVYINVGGTFSDPSYQIDAVAMAKEKYKAKLDKKIDKQKDKLLKKLDEKIGPGVSEKLKPALDNILKGLF